MHHDQTKKPLIPLLAAVAALTVANVTAEEKPRRGAAVAMMEEVQVTARKRSAAEAVQDVPLAISALGSEQLDAMFVQKLDDLSYTAPNVQLEAVGTFPGVQNFSIRGQGINSSIPSVDPTVGTFIDGVYLGVTYGTVLDMFDLEAIEILRGPQGLLFGRNVTGGAVNVRTALPGDEFSFKAKANLTDHDQYTVATAISFPVTDTLAGKVVLYRDDDQGYFDNDYDGTPTPVGAVESYVVPATPDSDVGAMETTFFRTAWRWNASDNLELILRGETGESEGTGSPMTLASAQRSSEDFTENPANGGPGNGGFGVWPEFSTQMDEEGLTDIEWNNATFELNYELDNGSITNIFGWREIDASTVVDIDGRDFQIFTVAARTQQDQISNELRYAGSFMDDKLDLTTGVYYFEQDISYFEGRLNLLRALGGEMDHSTWGLFASTDYHLSETLTLQAGLRYTEEEKDSIVIDSSNGLCPLVNTPELCPEKVNLKDDWQNWTPKLGLTYQLTDEAKLYTFWTKGFRSGGVNFRNAKPNVIPPGPTNEEEQNSFEIGIKSQLLDGRLRLNGAVFYNTIDDMQRELNLPDPDVVVLQATVNAGDATIQGFEVDFVALLTDSFSINGSVGYLDGSWDEINPAFDAAVNPTSPLILAGGFVGDGLPRLAPWTASFGFTYDLDLGDSGWLSMRSSYSFRDENPFTDNNREFFDKQHQVTASVDYNTADDHWKVSLYGKNLNDEARWGSLTPTASLGTVGTMQKGRVLGLEVQYNY